MSAPATTAYAGPRSLDHALQVRTDHPDWLVLAGATDVMVPDAGRAAPRAPGVLDLFGVPELHGIEMTPSGVRIGACTTYAELLAADGVRTALPLLWAAARDVGAVQIRERGTIGGNVVTSSPVGDMLPGLLALEGRVVVASVAASRAVPYEQFLRGYRQVDLAPAELLVAVEVPLPAPGTVQHWRKVGTRAAQAIAKVSIAAAARVADGRVVRFRLALGGVADRPVRLHDVEAMVEGSVAGRDLADAVRQAVRQSVHPITDVRSTAGYRAAVAGNLAARFVADLVPAPLGPNGP